MARRWNGFLAQNQEVKEQWGLLEESRRQIEARLEMLSDEEEPVEREDEEPLYVEVH